MRFFNTTDLGRRVSGRAVARDPGEVRSQRRPAALTVWAEADPKPLVLLLDEIDARTPKASRGW